MGFFDSNSDAINPSGTAGSQTQQGDATGISIVAGDDQNARVNVSTTNNFVDAGAIEAAREIAGDAADVTLASVETVERTTAEALDVSRDLGRLGLQVGADAVDRVFELADANAANSAAVVDLAGDAITANANLADDALNASLGFAGDIVGENQDFAERLTADNQSFAESVLLANQDFASQLTEQAFDAGGQLVDAVQQIAVRESVNTEGRLEEVSRNALFVVGGVAGVALIAFVVLGRR